jgi:predicted dehydrogenase
MPSRKLRWGVISTSNIGRVAVIPAIRAAKNSELVAVASRDAEKGRDFAQRLNIPRSYGSYEALLAAQDIEAVYIPLPNSLHREWAIKAAQSGKHILCEKPLALNAAECLEMEAVAQENHVKLMEAFMYRFHPQTQVVLELVKQGVPGKVHLVHSSFTFRLTRTDNIRFKPELGGGALMDVGCYCVNFSRMVIGSEPVEAQAYARWGSTGVDDQLVGTLRFADGTLAQFDCGLTLERRESFEVVGTEAALYSSQAFLPGTEELTFFERRGRKGEIPHKVQGADEYQLMVEYFADCVLEDKPLRFPASEAAANMRAIDALYRSARADGKPQPVQR